MDPNLRTLSLASWMSLPGFSYNEWETLQKHHQQQQQRQKQITSESNSINQLSSKSLNIHKIGNLSSNNLRRQALKNSSSSSNVIEICQKCIELRSKQLKSKENDMNNCDLDSELIINNNNNNNESEIGAMCCKCTKALKHTNNHILSSNKNNFNDRLKTETTMTNEKNNNQEQKQQEKIEKQQIPGSPPRRNLSLKRQISKEVQTRALVSRVAKYYEDYVRIMNLEKYFMNDAIVTIIAPIQEGSIQQEDKFRSARWLVCG